MASSGMRFDPELTRRVRDLLLTRGARESLPPTVELEGVVHEGTPERSAMVARVVPMAEALFLIMSADQRCDERERIALRGALRTMTDDEIDSRTVWSLLDQFDAWLETDGFDQRMATVAANLSADRADAEVALELAAAMIIVDGDVNSDERTALERLAEETGADPARALRLLE